MMRKLFYSFECGISFPGFYAVRLAALLLFWFCINTAWAKSFVAFGPENFSGKSAAVKSFQVLNPAVPYELHIYNGGDHDELHTHNGGDHDELHTHNGGDHDELHTHNGGDHGRYARVSSGTITLNGIDVVKPKDFHHAERHIEKPITLSKSNRLVVELHSNPKSSITLQVIGKDTDRPVITYAVEPLANGTGWHQNAVVVTFSCTDKTSGIASCSSPVTVSGEGAAQVIQGTAVDRAGNTATISVTINLDLTPPSIAASSESPNEAGWYHNEVAVSFNCSDALSGIASCSPPVTVTAEGAGQTLQGSATDKAGNTATTEASVNLDLTPPTITAASEPSPNTAGWHNSDVALSFNCSDALSGIASCSPPVTVTAEGAGQTLQGSATDKAGNSATTNTTVNLDLTPPSIAASSESPNEAGWYHNEVAVSFNCSDALSGIASCSPPLIVTAEGAGQTLQGSATDKAGNTATTNTTVNLDLTPPSIAVSSESPNEAGWYHNEVAVSFNCSDALSGIASCSPPVTVTAEGAGQTLQGSAADKAGNTATTNTTVNLDLTPPTLQITSPADGTVVLVNTVAVSGTVDDNLSGIAAVSCNGTPADFSGASFNCNVELQNGVNTVSVQVTDAAGNSAAAEIHVTLLAVNITEPANLSFFNFSPIRIAGTVAPQTSAVTVNGISASLNGGNWSASVPLSEGNNTLTAVAAKSDGSVNTASIQVTLDTTPPRVTVDAPADGFKTVEETITITGIVNDIVVGTVNSGQAQVTVNGIKAEVANRTYRADGIPLQLGVNSIQVIGKDQVGNSVTTTIKVTREAITQPFIKTVAGNHQRGAIATALGQLFVVQLLDGATPAANVPVLFKVVENDGYLRVDNGKKLQLIAVNTDSDGKAQATLTLGNRAGAGNNIVEAYAVGYQGTAVFTASATPQAAAHINVDAGTNQFGATNSALPLPFVAVVTDAGHNRLGGVPVTFTVTQGGGTINGKPTFETVSDSDGRALAVLTLGPEAGQDNNVVEANFPGNTGFAAAFAASAKTPGDPAQTAISGVVQDNSNAPIPGVTMRLYTTHQLINNNGVNNNQPLEVVTPVVTDANGQFKIAPAPVGFFKLMADGTTATVADQHYPTLEYDLVTVAGQDNGVGSPIYLPALDPDAKVCVDAKTGGTLKMASSPGFSLTIAPGSATFPGGSKTGCVTVTPVNPDKVPMVPGFGQQPRYVVTIQPVGTTFNPPAQMTIPNMDGLPPHAKTEMYSYDHDLAAFVAIGSATVSADGSVIASDPGIGVMKAGWHCGGNPNTTGDVKMCGIPNGNGSAAFAATQAASSSNDTCGVDIVQVKDDKKITDTTQEIMAGMMIELRADPKSPTAAISDHQWNVPGTETQPPTAIANYEADDNKATITPLSVLNDRTIKFYWIDGNAAGDERTVTYSGVVDGVSVSAKATFKVIRPEVHIKTTTKEVHVDSLLGFLTIHYSDIENPGIFFNSTVEGQNVSSIPGGAIHWVQTVDVLRKFQWAKDSTWKEAAGLGLLDKVYPYPSGPGFTEDSPFQELNDIYSAVVIADKYTMWLMFRPDGDDSIPVPLRKVDWTWNSEARNLPLLGWIKWSDNHDATPSDLDATELPKWNGNTNSFTTIP